MTRVKVGYWYNALERRHEFGFESDSSDPVWSFWLGWYMGARLRGIPGIGDALYPYIPSWHEVTKLGSFRDNSAPALAGRVVKAIGRRAAVIMADYRKATGTRTWNALKRPPVAATRRRTRGKT